MRYLKHMHVAAMDPRRFEEIVSPAEFRRLLDLLDEAAPALRGRVVWNVNSTYRGGGVAELLPGLLGYARGGAIDARWVVIRGEGAFFEATKRLHNHLHGFDGDGGLTEADRLTYERTLAANAAELVPLLGEGDIVILHDPQTAGLIQAVRATGALVIWRCHVGLDRPNWRAREAWDFLRRYVADADAYVFSRASFAWEGLERERISVIQPSIDAFSAKNQGQSPGQSMSILARAGLVSSRSTAQHPMFTRADGTPGRVDRRATVWESAPLAPRDPVVMQISRWDQLKDPLGVLRGFVEFVAPLTRAHLVLAGPTVDSVSDDPEGAAVLAEVERAWYELPDSVRPRVHLAALPMVDTEENAAIVNALQRHARVVVQKSLAEGFGLTVAEAMWKQRPVVASRIGGIQDQIADGISGVLLSDPRDLEEFGAAVTGLLSDRARARSMGAAAHERVREQFLAPRHLGRYFELIQQLVVERARLTTGARVLAGTGPDTPQLTDPAGAGG